MNTVQPTSKIDRLRGEARRHIRSGQWQAAEASLQSLLEHSPQDIRVWLELSRVVAQQGRWRESGELLVRATRHLPKHVPLIMTLVQQLMEHGEVVATRHCLDFLARAPEPPAEILKVQAGLRYFLGEYATVKSLLERALQAGVDDPESHYTYGVTLQFMGDMQHARQVLEKCIARWPLYSDAAVVLANMGERRMDKTLFAHAEKQLHKLEKKQRDADVEYTRAGFEHVRFKVLHDMGRCEEAWDALARCNDLLHALYPYDAKAETALTDALIRMPAADVGSTGRSIRHGGPVPIFIVGMPRSGTTLLERMLSAHSRVASAGEIIDFQRQLRNLADVPPGYPNGMLKIVENSDRINYQELGQRYLEQTRWRAGSRDFYVDKLPANIRMVAFIRSALPHAPILHMVRDPMDVCFSNLKLMFGSGAPYSYDMSDMAHFYRQYARLVEHWHQCLPGVMLDVDYADLVNEPERVMQRVLAHCGLEEEEACLYPERNQQPVATPSSAQVREPIHQRGIGQWQRYEAQLQPLKNALGELANGA